VIEQGLYFALGFLVCALLALATMPAVWRRAHRLVRRDLESSLPLSPREIAAERDQLRAKYAVEYRQRELATEKAEAQRQRALLEVGQKQVEIAQLGDVVSARDQAISTLTGERDILAANLEQTSATLAATEDALKALSQDHEVLNARHANLSAELAQLSDLSDQRRVEIAARDTNLEAQRARIDEIDAAMRKARSETRALTDQLRQAERQIRELETERDIAIKKGRIADAEVSRRESIIAERDGAIGAMIEERNRLSAALRDAEEARKNAHARAEVLTTDLEARDQAIGRLREDAKRTAQDLARSVEKLRVDKQKLSEDLEATRVEARLAKAAPARRTPARTDLRRAAPANEIDPAT
jgi:chromosome segregation ATPase